MFYAFTISHCNNETDLQVDKAEAFTFIMFAANVGLLLAPWDMTLFRMGSPFYLLAVTRSPTQRMFTACFTAMTVKKNPLLSFLLYNYFGYGYMKPVILICNGIQKCGARPFYGTQRDKVLGTEYSYYKPCSCTSTNFIMLWKTDTEIQFLNRTHRGSPSTTGGMRTIF